jgi:hypothetical protein
VCLDENMNQSNNTQTELTHDRKKNKSICPVFISKAIEEMKHISKLAPDKQSITQ